MLELKPEVLIILRVVYIIQVCVTRYIQVHNCHLLAVFMCIHNNAFDLKSVLFEINNAILLFIGYTLLGVCFPLFLTFMYDIALSASLLRRT